MRLAAQRVRSDNQLHALLRNLTLGGGPRALKANTAGTLQRMVIRPKSIPEVNPQGARVDLVREMLSIDTRLGAVTEQMTETLRDYHGSTRILIPPQLLKVDGISPVFGGSLPAVGSGAQDLGGRSLKPWSRCSVSASRLASINDETWSNSAVISSVRTTKRE